MLGRPHISELELEFLRQAQRLAAVRQKVNYPKLVQIGIIVHLGYKRLMAAMAELAWTGVPPTGSQTAVRL